VTDVCVWNRGHMFAEMCMCDPSDRDVMVLTFAIANSYIGRTAHTMNTRLQFYVHRYVKTEYFTFWYLHYTRILTYGTHK